MSEKNSTHQYIDEQQDRETLRELYSLNKSYRKTAQDFEDMRGVALFPSMVRMLIMGYEPGKKIREVLNWPPLAEVPACPECGRGHAVGWCVEKFGEPKRPRKNKRPKKSRSKIVSIGKPTPGQEKIVMDMTPQERLDALLLNEDFDEPEDPEPFPEVPDDRLERAMKGWVE